MGRSTTRAAWHRVARILGVSMLMAFAGVAFSQQAVYPTKPIRLIVPFVPGGASDPSARVIAQKLSEKLGQPVIINNRPGGGSITGTDVAAKSAPDGYTFLLVSTPFVTPSLYHNLPYDPIKDFDAVATVARYPAVLVVGPSVAANNLQEFVTLAKSRSTQLNNATPGVGSLGHLAGELLNMTVGAKIEHVAYKGSAPAMTDLLGGQVQLTIQPATASIAFIRSGKLRALAVTGDTRTSTLPQVPTFAEAGLPVMSEMTSWTAIVAPAGTPKAIINRVSSEIAQILAMPDVRETITNQVMEPYISTPEQFAALIRADIARNARIIKAANIKIEN